jgi:hypothetical protein
MKIACPVCRAENDTGPACRRCRADLVPLFELEQRRADTLRSATCAASHGAGDAVLRYAHAAHQMRQGTDAFQCFAVGFLLQRDFARARRYWFHATA